MSGPVTVRMGGRDFAIPIQPLKVMKRVIPLINRALEVLRNAPTEGLSEEQIDQVIAAVAAGCGIEASEIEALPTKIQELSRAVNEIVAVNMVEAADPNAPAAMPEADGTPSTPASPPEPDGAGQTSTS